MRMANKTTQADDATPVPTGPASALSVPVVCAVFAALAAISFIIYYPVLHAPFIFDDMGYIKENRFVHDLGNFTDLSGTRYVTLLTFALNYAAGGTDTFGYHLVNVLIHSVNGVLLFILLAATLRTGIFEETSLTDEKRAQRNSLIFAFAAATLFICHPVQTQAVSYLTQRFASLATLFYLLTFVLYIAARRRSATGEAMDRTGWAFYILALIAAVVAMKTKEIAFTLPVMLALYDFTFLREPREAKKRLLYLAPFLLTMAVIPYSIFLGGTAAAKGATVSESLRELQIADMLNLSHHDYLMTQFTVVVTYLRLLVLPINQNLDYDFPARTSFFDPVVTASFIFLAALFAGALWLLVKSRRERRGLPMVAAFGVLWFFIALSIESSVVPIRDVIFEHRLYLPSVGAVLAFAAAVKMGVDRVYRRGRNDGHGAAAFLIAVSIVLAAATVERNRVWTDEVSVWADVAEKSPGKSRGLTNLGSALSREGRTEEALVALSAAVAIRDGYTPLAHYNLGRVLIDMELYNDALVEMLKVLDDAPTYSRALNNAGLIFRRRGETSLAISYFDAAIDGDPYNAEAFNNKGFALQILGDYEGSEKEYGKALELAPRSSGFHSNLAALMVKQGRMDEARAGFERAVELDPHNYGALSNLGNILYGMGEVERALVAARSAVQVRPGSADARFNLAIILIAKDLREEAAAELRRVIEINPADIEAKRKLESIGGAAAKN